MSVDFFAGGLYEARGSNTATLRKTNASEIAESEAIDLINLDLCSRLSVTWTKYEEKTK
jgi:hypothetical protein